MARLWKWLRRLIVAGIALVVVLAFPVVFVEVACRGQVQPDQYTALLPPEDHRAEARTLMTYPEWHIVHAYDDYAEVIHTGDPHDFAFARSILGFWTSLCALNEQAGAHGGVDIATKQMVYVIGVSFTAEMAMKAAYEETLGRATTWLRGPAHSALDDLSAQQARDYARFLQQVPWYKWDFRADRAALRAQSEGGVRDTERRIALGLEYGAKAAYAGVIENAVASVGADALRLRMIVTGITPEALAEFDDVRVIDTGSDGIVIETPRYRALSTMLTPMAKAGVQFVEIAGNDDIMLTALAATGNQTDALYSFDRQGYGDTRHLILLPVRDLAKTLLGLQANGLTLEHVHDY